MSTLAWRILAELITAWQEHTAFLLDWHIAELLNLSYQKFDPHTDAGRAIQELIDKGLVRKVPVVGEYHGYRIIVLEEKGK